jgi:Uma2 family endonuclease
MANMNQPAESPPEWFRLRGVEWPTYRAISTALMGRHLRFTYDGDTLEFSNVTCMRGSCRALLGLFIYVLAEETGLPIRSCGDMTLERPDLERAIEPDDSFYLANEPIIRARTEIDLMIDPSPDLAVEIAITPGSGRRMRVLEAIGIPEVWRFDGNAVTIHVQGADGRFVMVESSRIFPIVSGSDLIPFLEQWMKADTTGLVGTFRAWVRKMRN